MNSFDSILHFARVCQVIFTLFIIFVPEIDFAQSNHLIADQPKDTLGTGSGILQTVEERSLPSPVFLRRNRDFGMHNGPQDSPSIMMIWDNYPELRHAALHEFISLHLSEQTGIDILQSTPLELNGNPILENELRLKMRRYGVPYDPQRPRAYQFGITFSLRDFIAWLKNIFKQTNENPPMRIVP